MILVAAAGLPTARACRAARKALGKAVFKPGELGMGLW